MKEIVVVTQNRAGLLADISENLAANGINIETIDAEEIHDTAVIEWDTPRDMTGIEGYYYIMDHNPNTVPDPATATWTTSNSATFQWMMEGYPPSQLPLVETF